MRQALGLMVAMNAMPAALNRSLDGIAWLDSLIERVKGMGGSEMGAVSPDRDGKTAAELADAFSARYRHPLVR